MYNLYSLINGHVCTYVCMCCILIHNGNLENASTVFPLPDTGPGWVRVRVAVTVSAWARESIWIRTRFKVG